MKIDKIILGTVQFGLDYGINNNIGKISIDDSFKILKNAFQSGIKVLDSSEKYGNAHDIIGRFHVNNQDIRFKIITKLPPNELIDDLHLKVENYLNVLKVDCLECLMFHSFDSYLSNKSIIEEFNILKKSKKIKNIGVSIYTNKQMESLIDFGEIDVIQIPFNLLDNLSVKRDLIIKAKNKGIVIHARSVFLQGLFFKSTTDQSKTVKNLKKYLIKINDLASKENIHISDLALNYVVQQNLIDNVLIGVDSQSQLISNIQSLKTQLNKSTISNIDNIRIHNKDLINPTKWN